MLETHSVQSLKQIAAWSCTHVQIESPIRASVPALQRGLVWKPQQIEMLWDSILRGFPIGAFVICPIIASQKKEGENGRGITHHLLDGQQRANGISLAFYDPFMIDSEDPESVLWIDLAPNIPSNSTRQYLIRLTTKAHPWGYNRWDGCGTLSAENIREALQLSHFKVESPKYKRPDTKQIGPADAVAPVPIAWVLQAFEIDPREPWAALAEKIQRQGITPWKDQALEVLQTVHTSEPLKHIEQAIRQLDLYKIVLLQAPTNLLKAALHETPTDESGNISNIEHLFQRLNQQGTQLDGEELAFSMIKAYWPKLVDPIEQLYPRRMPTSRLVATVVRAAQACTPDSSSETLTFPGMPSISRIRSLAADRNADSVSAISRFFNDRMQPANDRIERWLSYNAASKPNGLLPVHLQEIAKDSRDLYALLFYLAERCPDKETEQASAAIILRMVAHLHWFAMDKGKAVRIIHGACAKEFSPSAIEAGLRIAFESGDTLLTIPSPLEFKHFVTPAEDEDLQTWSWWGLVSKGDSEERNKLLQDIWWNFIHRVCRNRELLLYAQRHYIAHRFADYDPSRRDYWEDHNRPWDFDHILAQKFTYNIKRQSKDWLMACHQVVNTIGNLRAWPFEDNRSDSAVYANEKIQGEQIASSFLLPEELPSFSGGSNILVNTNGSAEAFIHACIQRVCRIYGEVYEGIGL